MIDGLTPGCLARWFACSKGSSRDQLALLSERPRSGPEVSRCEVVGLLPAHFKLNFDSYYAKPLNSRHAPPSSANDPSKPPCIGRDEFCYSSGSSPSLIVKRLASVTSSNSTSSLDRSRAIKVRLLTIGVRLSTRSLIDGSSSELISSFEA